MKTVLWISGPPDSGKTTLRKLLTESRPRGPVFSTDRFVCQLHEWCPNETIGRLAQEHSPRRIGRFWDMMSTKYPDEAVELLLDEQRGVRGILNKKAIVYVIEGYVTRSIQSKVMQILETENGCYVWVVARSPVLDRMSGRQNWREK